MKKSMILVVAGIGVLAVIWYVSSSQQPGSRNAQVQEPAPVAAMVASSQASSEAIVSESTLSATEKRDLLKLCNAQNKSKGKPVQDVHLYAGITVSGEKSATDIGYTAALNMAKQGVTGFDQHLLRYQADKLLQAHTGGKMNAGFAFIQKQGYAVDEANTNTDHTVCTSVETSTRTDDGKLSVSCKLNWPGDVLVCLY